MTDWDEMLEKHGPHLWRTARRLLGNVHDADECLQDAFLAAWNYSRSRPIRNGMAFLRTTLVRTALNRLRRGTRCPVVPSELPPDPHVPAKDPLPEEQIAGRELVERLRVALAGLPIEEAEVVCLCCMEQMKHSEVAEALGINAGTVGVRLHRARNRLRGMLGAAVDPRREGPQ